MKKRCVSIILILAILSSFIVVPTSAAGENRSSATTQGVVISETAKNYWDGQFSVWFLTLLPVGSDCSQSRWKDMCWATMDYAFSRYGAFSSLAQLTQYSWEVRTRLRNTKVSQIDQFLNESPNWDLYASVAKVIFKAFSDCFPNDVAVEQFAGYGWCVSDGKGNMLCRSGGQIAYYMEPEQAEGEAAAVLGGKWVDSAFRDGVPGLHLYSYRSTLETVADRLCDLGQTCGVQSWTYKNEKYWYILKERGSSVYADKRGRPYVVRQSSDYAVDKDQNYYAPGKDSGDTYNQQLVDLLTGILNAPRGDTVTQGDNSLYLEDGAIYNPDNRSYSFTATNSFNTTTNNYYTYNYSYTYHINYTSVTYIGTTAQYDEIYKYYYELPDGRSSADLTADELLALNTEIDVVPYTRSTDNTALRSLYHLDGNVKDSSYWNYLTSWEWTKGASITYMESPSPFGGYLYLDETEHEWNLNLSSGLGSQDFTLQFRLYQKATATPQADSYIAFGANQVLKFDGGDFTFNGTAHLMPVGTWNEFALIRDSGSLRLYLNGVQVDSYTNTAAFSKVITFHFGSQQQTTKGIDEVRVLNYALQTGGANYDAATAPFDTNLSLILPDGGTPVADEYWSFRSSKTNLLSQYSMDDWTDYFDGSKSNLASVSYDLVYSSSGWGISSGAFTVVPFSWPTWGYIDTITSLSALDRSFSLSVSQVADGSLILNKFFARYSSSRYDSYFLTGGLFTSIAKYKPSSQTFSGSFTSGTYTFSMVASDGTVGSVTFSVPVDGISSVDKTISFNGYRIGFRCLFNGGTSSSRDSYNSCLVIQPEEYGTVNPFVYLELVEGDSTDLSAEFVSYVAPVNTDFKTPTLAVRTDQTITGYQIGGVRPSLPEKGLVYALVENSRITSLQIYNGSMWEKVDGRIWTGSRWVPYYAYDILLFKDLWDIVEADPSQDYIYTESGFWSWLQKAWGQMIVLLTDIRDRITGGSGGTGVDSSVVGPDSSTLPPVADDDGSGWSFVDLASVLVKSGWKICTGTVTLVFGGISGMTDAITNLTDGFNGFNFMNSYDGTISQFSGTLDYAESSADSSG